MACWLALTATPNSTSVPPGTDAVPVIVLGECRYGDSYLPGIVGPLH